MFDCIMQHKSDREKKEGLPVTNFMDREQVTKSNAQLVFIKTILLPMFESLLMVFFIFLLDLWCLAFIFLIFFISFLQLFPQIKEPIIQPLIEAFMRYEKMKNDCNTYWLIVTIIFEIYWILDSIWRKNDEIDLYYC